MILYSGQEEEDAHHTEGVALMAECWEAAGPMIYASFKRKKENIKLKIIQCYAPTNDKNEETKEDFYNKLQNGEMLADFCAFNNMIIGGSVFPHRRIHKATWVLPDHRTEN